MRFTPAFLAAALTLVAGSNARADGGPDDFGYTWTDGAYAWIDVREEPGAVVWDSLGDDEATDPIDLGFPFAFYGQVFTQVYLHSNGFLTFAPTDTESSRDVLFECPLPRPGAVDGAIYFHVRDWDPTGGGTVHTATIGIAPNRSFVVQFTDVPRISRRGGLVDPMTIEVILDETTNDIRFQALETGSREGGDGAIGIEAPDGIAGLSTDVCRTEGSLPDETAISIRYPTGELAVLPRAQPVYGQPGAVLAGEVEVFNLSAADLSPAIQIDAVWPVTTEPSGTMVLPAGGHATLAFEVDVPANAVPGDAALGTITLTAQEGITVSIPMGVQRPSQGAWQSLPPLGSPASEMLVAVTDDAIWTAGGMVLGLFDEVVDVLGRYDLRTHRWSTSQDSDLAPLPDGRRLSAGCVLDGRLFVVGGLDRSPIEAGLVAAAETMVYDIASNTWSEGASLPEARYQGAAMCDAERGLLFVFGGVGDDLDGDFGGDAIREVAVYDPAADAWSTAGTLPGDRYAFATIAMPPDRVLLVGGVDGFDDVPLVDEFDVAAGTFSDAAPLPVPLAGLVGGLLDGEACVAGGVRGFSLSTDWYCLGDGQWIPQTDALPFPDVPASPEGGGVAGGRFYVLGGSDGFQQEPNPLLRWPSAPLPEGDGDADADADADADTDADADADADGDTDADADADGDGDAGDEPDGSGGCCRVAPGRPTHAPLLVVAALVGLALRRPRRR